MYKCFTLTLQTNTFIKTPSSFRGSCLCVVRTCLHHGTSPSTFYFWLHTCTYSTEPAITAFLRRRPPRGRPCWGRNM